MSAVKLIMETTTTTTCWDEVHWDQPVEGVPALSELSFVESIFKVESRLGVADGKGGRESTGGVLVSGMAFGDVMGDEVVRGTGSRERTGGPIDAVVGTELVRSNCRVQG